MIKAGYSKLGSSNKNIPNFLEEIEYNNFEGNQILI